MSQNASNPTSPIRLAILLAGETNRSMLDSQAKYTDLFTAFFASKSDTIGLEFVAVRDGAFPSRVDAYDGYLVTGSLYGVYDDPPWIGKLMAFVREAYQHNIPLLGVCFGHQLIAHALGGKAELSNKGWVAGGRTLPVLCHPLGGRATISDKPATTLTLLYTHQDQVVALPPDAQAWLGDDLCPIAGMTIPNKVLTVQGHPEFSADYLTALLQVLRPKLGDTHTDQAIASIKAAETHTHHARVRDWMVEFLTRNARKQKSAA